MNGQETRVKPPHDRVTQAPSIPEDALLGPKRHAGPETVEPPVPWIRFDKVDAWYGQNQVLRQVTFDVPRHSITAFIGPSGCGKTTLLRSVNRLNDRIPAFRLEGRVVIGDVDIYARNGGAWVNGLRRRTGMVFQASNPLPVSVLDNLTLPLYEHHRIPRREAEEMAVEQLQRVHLYDEVRDKLRQSALRLSGGQQQRLCIARALMLDPEVLLLDEPCSALDPISTYRIEDLLSELKSRYTIVMVTHNMEQASRIADRTAFFHLGGVLEEGPTAELFQQPKHPVLRGYLRGEL